MKSQTDAVSKPSAAALRAASKIAKRLDELFNTGLATNEACLDESTDAIAPLIDAEFKDVVSALRQLHDLQNGPPLFKYEKQWMDVMERTAAALSRTEGA